jgi:predicted GH43/DUF377 family glycosyl hydrolase
MCYTAFDGKSEPRIALTSIAVSDFLVKRWEWARSVLISPPGRGDKDAAIFPQKIRGKYAILHRVGTSIWLDLVDSLSLEEGRCIFEEGVCIKGTVIMNPRQEKPAAEKIGVAAPPIETKSGWLLLYHTVTRKNDVPYYSVSAALLDIDDPTQVIARRQTPLLEPEMPYEKEGQVANVVFPCGAVVINNRLFVYYGGADKVIGVATVALSELLEGLLLQARNSRRG